MSRRTLTQRVNGPALPPGPVTIPYRFQFRSYQKRLGACFMPKLVTDGQGRWLTDHPNWGTVNRKKGVWVCHRGAGKDLTALAGLIIPHMLMNPGVYWHVFPKFTQGKKAIWLAQTEDGMPYLDRFPPHLLLRKNDTEMLVQIKSLVADPLTGEPYPSTYQIVGGDTLSEHLVGAGPKGIVYSEWPIMDESAYQFMAPRLAQTGGWVLFIYTPRGKNHGYKFYQEALANPAEWFCEVLTIRDTRKDAPGEDGGPVVTAQQFAEQCRLMPEELVHQELLCSFDGYLVGTIYGDCLRAARADKRIVGNIPREVNIPVGCCLDIGRSDGTAIWFYQTIGREIRLIDYLAFRANKVGDLSAAHYAIKQILAKPYLVTRIVLPNDAQIKGYSASQSTQEVFEEHFRDVVLLDKIPVQQGIDMARQCFSRIVIDEVRCSAPQADNLPSGLDSLGNYRRQWDADKNEFRPEPVHDDHSHGADAFRYGAMEGFTQLNTLAEQEWKTTVSDGRFSVFDRGPALIGAR